MVEIARASPTGESLDRVAMASRRELEALREIIEARLDARDKADIKLSEDLNRVPTLLDREITRISQVFEGQFKAVTALLVERDIRFDLALAALKEAAAAQHRADEAAIGKSDAAFKEQIMALQAAIVSAKDMLNTHSNAIESRVDKIEFTSAGSQNHRTENRANVSLAIAAAGLLFAIVSGFVGYNLGHNVAVVSPIPVAAPVYNAAPPVGATVPGR